MSSSTPSAYAPADAHRVKRLAHRARYDAATVHAILDSGYVCQIAFIDDGRPQLIPMSYWRDGEQVHFHAGARSRFARVCRDSEVALSVTLMDALVLGHSPINHSMNYRSVVVHGRPQAIDDRAAKARAMQSFFAKTIPGRWETLRPPRDDEFDAVTVFRLPLEQVAAKVRNEFPDDEEHPPAQPVWTGLVPLHTVCRPPVADPRFAPQPLPACVAGFTGKPDFDQRVENA